MLWCEIHNSTGVKGGITNFDSSEYEKELSWLQQCTQVRDQGHILVRDIVEGIYVLVMSTEDK